MKRLVVLLAISAGLRALGAVACGGSDKPPLTPDSTDDARPSPRDAGGSAAPPPAN